jgi:hypothetical protein
MSKKRFGHVAAPDPYTGTVDLENDLTFANRNVGNQRRTGTPTEEPLMRKFLDGLAPPRSGDPAEASGVRTTDETSLRPHQHEPQQPAPNLHSPSCALKTSPLT